MLLAFEYARIIKINDAQASGLTDDFFPEWKQTAWRMECFVIEPYWQQWRNRINVTILISFNAAAGVYRSQHHAICHLNHIGTNVGIHAVGHQYIHIMVC